MPPTMAANAFAQSSLVGHADLDKLARSADFVYWPKSAEVMIMTILGGIDYFWGPVVGAATLVLLNQEITSYTEYWPLALGIILVILLFVFPGGIVGGLTTGVAWLCRKTGGRERA